MEQSLVRSRSGSSAAQADLRHWQVQSTDTCEQVKKNPVQSFCFLVSSGEHTYQGHHKLLQLQFNLMYKKLYTYIVHFPNVLKG